MLARRSSVRPALARARAARTLLVVAIAALTFVDCSVALPAESGGLLSNALAPSSDRVPRATLSDVMADAQGTYIDRMLAERDSTLERWPDHLATPLRVWIDSTSAERGARGSFPAAVRAAFADWAATGIPIRFAYVASPRDADVRVRWTDFLDHKTGSTTWRTNRGDWLTGSDITLAMHISTGPELDGEGMHAIALHEIGHALGLAHSDDVHDIMAPLVRVRSLSSADKATVRLLYSYAAGPLS